MPVAQEVETFAAYVAALDEKERSRALAKVKMLAVKDASPEALDAATHDADFRVVMTPYSEIDAKLTRWTWDRRIPVGMLSLMVGTEGLGKTAFGLGLAADLTTGDLPGEFHGTPVKVALFTPEDDAGATVRKRLEARGADMARVFDVQMRKNATARGFSLPDDTAVIAEALIEQDIRFVFADPLASLLDPRINSWKDTDIREALEPIIAVLAEHDITMLGSLHTNKANSTDARQRGMGSAGWQQLARAVFLVGLDPDDESGKEGSSRCVAHTKHNLGPWTKTVRFALETVPVKVENTTQETVRATLGDECDVKAAAMLAHEQGHEDAGKSKEDKASRWLRRFLMDGPKAVAVVMEAADDAGHAWRTVERVKKDVGVESKQVKGARGLWTWQLRDADALEI